MSASRARAPAVAAALVVALAARVAAADGGAGHARALVDLDDAMACLPLDDGAFAVATGGGLALVDRDGGVRSLTALDGLPDTRVRALALDGGALWVGTETGAARVELGRDLRVSRTLAVGDTAVHAVLATASGVYLGTWGAGLFRLAAPDAPPELVPTSSPARHIAALAEHGGSVYAAYADGPVARLEHGTLTPVAETPSHGQSLVSVVHPGGPAELVLGDLEGLFRVADVATPFAPLDARGLAASGDRLFVATFGAGLESGSASGALHREHGVPRFTRGVAVRGEDRCVATTEGAFVARGGGGWHKLALGGLPSNDVTVIEAHGDRVAVGTFDHGGAIVEGGAVVPVAGLEPTEAVNALAWQGEGAAAALWLGTAHGLVRVAPDGNLHRLRAADGLPSSMVRAIVVRPDGRLLVGTDEGGAVVQGDKVSMLAPKPKGWVPLASPMHATWALAVSPDGTTWIGTMAGLYMSQSDGRYRRLAVATGDLRDDWVTALAVRGQDVLVGTYAGGVTRLHVSGATVEHVHMDGGCINPAGLTLVGDRLYAATMEGLLVRPVDEVDARWERVANATPGRDVTSVRAVGDALWVASRRGIGVR